MTLSQNPAWLRVAIDPEAMGLVKTTDLDKVVKFVIELGVALRLQCQQLSECPVLLHLEKMVLLKGIQRNWEAGAGRLILLIKNGVC